MKQRNKKNNSLTQSPHNQGKARDLPAALIQWFYEETLPGEGRQTWGRRRGKAIILNQSQHDPIGELRSLQGYWMWLTCSVSPGEGGPRWCSRREPSEPARLQTRRHRFRLHHVTTHGWSWSFLLSQSLIFSQAFQSLFWRKLKGKDHLQSWLRGSGTIRSEITFEPLLNIRAGPSTCPKLLLFNNHSTITKSCTTVGGKLVLLSGNTNTTSGNMGSLAPWAGPERSLLLCWCKTYIRKSVLIIGPF